MTTTRSRHQSVHTPVLLREVVTALAPADNGIYLDATFGDGGYSQAILDAAPCTVIAIDRDPDAIARGEPLVERYGGRLRLAEGRFSQMRALVDDKTRLDGIAFDLGVCSTQLDQAERGFSFRLDGPLDMRMSKQGQSAAEVVMSVDEAQLVAILRDYGEERAARRIARAIIAARRKADINTTGELAAIIRAVMPSKKPGQNDPATRSFQALRIHVNRELEEVEDGLAAAECLLKPGGVLAVVSFHSLEDRIVKRFLAARGGKAARPSRHLPEAPAPDPTFKVVTKRPITPTQRESDENARARSARLRVAHRTASPLGGFEGPAAQGSRPCA